MSRQLLSELVITKSEKMSQIPSQKKEQVAIHQSLRNIIDSNEIQITNRLFQVETMPNVESDTIEANNIKKFVNQSNKYWKQEREMFAQNKMLSQSFQSENIDNSSCGYNSTNNQINNFNSNTQNEIKIGIQDLLLDISQNGNQNNVIIDLTSDNTNNSRMQVNNHSHSFQGYQLNASQQEYIKTPVKRRQINSSNGNYNQGTSKQSSNLENILSNLDFEEFQKPQSSYNQNEIKYVNNQKQLEGNYQQSNQLLNHEQQKQSSNQSSEQRIVQRRSVSTDSGKPLNINGQIKNNNIFNKQTINVLSNEVNPKSNPNSINLEQKDYEIQTTFSQPIRDKTENTDLQNTGLNNSFSIGEDSQYTKKEINTINKTGNKQTLSIHSQMKNSDAQFVFSYTKKQAACFPKDIKLNEKYLEVLELSHNKFKVFPEEIYQFRQLKRLKIDNNFIRTIPAWFFNVVNLQELSISNNLVSEIPINISRQINLITLDISQNRIGHLPEQLSQLKALQSLNISNNEFTYIPVSLKDLLDGNLRELHLDWFKYCNPPLNSLQINSEAKYYSSQNKTNQNNTQINSYQSNNYQFQINGAHNLSSNQRNQLGSDVICPLKKLNQLLFRFEQQQLYNQYQKKLGSAHQKLEGLQIFKSLGYFYSFSQFVNEMSSNGFLLNIRNSKGQTLMHLAAENEDIGVIECLNKMDQNLKNECDQNRHSPLSLSISEEKYFAAKKLLQLNGDANIGGSIYGSPLNIATIKGQIYLIQDIVQKKANPNLQDVDGNTCMHYIMTIYSRDIINSAKIAQLLLELGANPNLKNNDGWTPLHLAVRRSQYSAVKFAIDYNKVQQLKKNNKNEQVNKDKSTDFKKYIPMNYCKPPFKVGQAQENQINNLQEFDFTIKGGVDKWSCLHISCFNNDIKITKMLLELKEVDFFACNRKNQTPLFLSSKGNSLSKLMKIYQNQRLIQDLQIKLNQSSLSSNYQSSDCDLDSYQIKLITDGCISPINNNIKEKTGVTLTESSQVSDCQKEVKIQILNNTKPKAPSQGIQQQNFLDQGKTQSKFLQNNQSVLPEHINVGNLLVNLTSPQEKTLPFHLQKKFVHPKIQSKKAMSYDVINFDEDEDNEDIGEFPSQHFDDYNMKDIDENNQIKEIRMSKEGNILSKHRKFSNQHKSVDQAFNNILDFENSPVAQYKNKFKDKSLDPSDQKGGQSTQLKQKHHQPSYSFQQINKKPSQSKLKSSFEMFTQKICKIQQKHFVDEEKSEIQIQRYQQNNDENNINQVLSNQTNSSLIKGYSTQRDFNYNSNSQNQMDKFFNSDNKYHSINQYNFNKNQQPNNHDQTYNTNQSYALHSIPNGFDSQNNLDTQNNLPTEQNHNKRKLSEKEHKKLSHNILRYSHDDKDGNMFCIPKLQSGENRQQIIFQTIQNIFSLFISGTIQYKKSLIDTIQSLADKYKQIVIILKLFTEAYSRMEQFVQENSNYLSQYINSSQSTHSIKHIKNHTIFLLQDLLLSINTTPVNYRTLMRFVEDNNEEFQENLLILRQSQEKSTSHSLTARSNAPIPVPQGDSASGSQSAQSSARSIKNSQYYQNFSNQVLLHQQQQQSMHYQSVNKEDKFSSVSTNTPQSNNTPQIYSYKDEIIENSQKAQLINIANQDIITNQNLLVKEYLLSTLIKVDLQPQLDLQILTRFQQEDQNLLLQFESFQTEGYLQWRKNHQNTTPTNNGFNQQSQIYNFTSVSSVQNREQSVKEQPKFSNPIFKPPFHAKREIPVSNSMNGPVQINHGVSQLKQRQPQAINNNMNHLNSSAPQINSQISIDQASTLNTTNTNTNQRTNISNSKNHNYTLNSSYQNTSQQSQNITLSTFQNPQQIQPNMINISSVISQNKIFSYQNKDVSNNGYFNSQVLQNKEEENNPIIFHKPLSRINITNKPPTITKIPAVSQEISNSTTLYNQNNDTNSQTSIIRLQTSESSETYNLNENLENSFLNDEAIIANKYLNSQVNKFQKYK